MKSTTQPSLFADAMIGVVDSIRGAIHGALGTRPWSVAIVTRTWSGGRVGVGTPSDAVMELQPTPMVSKITRDRFGPAGRESSGQVQLTEVSLAYTELELVPKLAPGQEIGYRVREIHGQQQADRWYVVSGGPTPRRGDKSGDNTDWYIILEQTSAMGNLDGVDAP